MIAASQRGLICRLWTSAVMTCLLFVFVSSVSAQNGNFSQFGVYHWSVPFPVERGFADLSDGDLHLEIPIAAIPQRGHVPYAAALVYDSHIWQPVASQGSFTWQATNVLNSWGGWRLVTSDGTGENAGYQFSIHYCTGPHNIQYPYTVYNGFSFTAPDGHIIGFSSIITERNSSSYQCVTSQPSSSALDDGQWGYHMYVTNYTSITVFAPDGTQVYPSVVDTNGNSANTIGGTPLTTSTNGNQTTYNIVNSAGSTYPIVVTTESIPVSTNFGQSGKNEFSGNITVVQSIQLPDSSSYSFNYDQGTTAGHYGVLTGMTLPSGGSVTYSHAIFQNAWGYRYLFIASRASGGGTWTYTPTVITTCGTNCQQTVKISKPNNSGSTDDEVHTFSFQNSSQSPLDTQQQYYSGSASSGTLLKTVSVTYSGDLPQTITNTVPVPGGTSITSQTKITYDSNGFGNTTQRQDWGYYTGAPPSSPFRTTQYTYLANSDNNMVNKTTSVTVSGGGTVYFTTTINYDNYSSGQPTVVSGAYGHDDTNFGQSYTARGNPTSIVAAGTTTLTYDTTGQVLSAADQKNQTTTYTYADNFYTDSGTPPIGSGSNAPAAFSPSQLTNAYVKTITPPLNGAITLGHYYGSGKVAIVTDQNGLSFVSHYLDGQNWDRPSTTYLPGGEWLLNNYTSATQLDSYKGITDTNASTGCSSCVRNQIVVDGLGRLSTSSLVSDPEGQTTATTTYGQDGRVLNVTNPKRSTSSLTDGSSTLGYDPLGRGVQITDQDGSIAKAYYGPQVTTGGGNASQSCSSSTYGLGYPTLYADEAGKLRQTWSDAFGNTIEADEPDPANNNALDLSTCYQYDALGNLVKVTQGAQTRTYGYDLSGRIISARTPETNGQATSFFYTTSGGSLCSGNPYAVCRKTDARNITTAYTYDALNRLTGVSYANDPSNTPSVSYSYDSTSCPVSGVSNYGKGRRTGMSDGSGSTSWCYDGVGRVVVEQRTIAGATKTTQYAYNLDGTLASVTYPSGHTMTYTTTNAERYKAVVDSTSGTQYAQLASYAPPGILWGALYGQAGTFSGITQQDTYNSRLEPASTQVSSSAGTALNLSYCFGTFSFSGGCTSPATNNDGNITGVTNNVTSGLSESFTYDSLSRVLSGATQSNSVSGCWGETLGASGTPDDRWSNLTQINVTQCTGGSLSVNASSSTNQLSTSGYQYDAAGNMTQEGGTVGYTYTFDAENRLIQASGTLNGPYCYVYDGDGLRVEKFHANGGTCVQPQNKVVDALYFRSLTGDTTTETDGSGNLTSEYVFFAGGRLARRDAGNHVFYYQVDQLGSTVAMTDSGGNPCYQASFTPYGEEHATQNTCAQNYKFAGYERDAETGLDYAFARYYNPRLGRFLSPDPLGGDISDPQSLNRYAYVGNSPTNLTDPTGMLVPLRNPGGDWCEITGDCGFQYWINGGLYLAIYTLFETWYGADNIPVGGWYGLTSVTPLWDWSLSGGGGGQLAAIINKALGQAKLKECLKEFFGSNVSLTSANAPNIDGSQTSAQLGNNAGLTKPALVPDVGTATVFVASEIIANEDPASPTATPGFASRVYLHEVGNALAMQNFTNEPNKGNRALLGPMGGPPTPDQQAQAKMLKADPNSGADPDIGRQFEKCIYGGSASGSNQKP